MSQTEIARIPDKELEKYKAELKTDVEKAEAFIVNNDEDRSALVEIGVRAKSRSSFFAAIFKDGIDGAHKLHKGLVADKTSFTTPYGNIHEIARTKVFTYDNVKAEAQRQIDLKKQQEETDKHNRAIKAAEKRVEGLLEGVQDNQMKIDVLTDQLANGNFTEDEAGIMREQITLLETAIQNKQEKVETVVAKVEEKAPVTYVAPPVAPKNWTGTVVDVKELCRAIADGKIGVGAVKTWNMPFLHSLKKNGQDVPGMSFVPDHGKGQRLK